MPKSDRASGAVTLQDVARRAGVSTATVSRALSNPALLSQATRDKVLLAVEETGYRVNVAARNLRKQQAGAVLVLAPDLGNPSHAEILAGVADRLAEAGLDMLLVDTVLSPMSPGNLKERFQSGRFDSVLSLDGELPDDILGVIKATGMTLAFAGKWRAERAHTLVRPDIRSGVRQAMAHLRRLGHEHIACIAGPQTDPFHREFVRAFNDEILAPDTWTTNVPASIAGGHDAAVDMLVMEPGERPSAALCASDMIAFGVIGGLSAGGLEVPGQLSVIGFEDLPVSQGLVPALTTIRQDRRQIGYLSADLLLEALNADPPVTEVTTVELPVTFEERESTARYLSNKP